MQCACRTYKRPQVYTWKRETRQTNQEPKEKKTLKDVQNVTKNYIIYFCTFVYVENSHEIPTPILTGFRFHKRWRDGEDEKIETNLLLKMFYFRLNKAQAHMEDHTVTTNNPFPQSMRGTFTCLKMYCYQEKQMCFGD